MKRFLRFSTMAFAVAMLFASCEKKPLTLDEETSMKTLLKASDNDIKELVVKEVTKQVDIPEENINIEYILRDEKSQTLVVKTKIEE